ncbi:MAG: biosynthetic-type acetolactate synthase large subunit [Deltaproteobacteria bacterium]
MKKNGAQLFVDCLIEEGVDTVFGFPGGAVLPVYDVLYDSKLRHILVRHEQGAVHMADGYARATGRPGVVLVTSGPGATNTVTGIATAYMDSIPVVVFTGQVPTELIGNDAFQEADIVGITRPCTKHNYLVKDIKELPRIIKEAFYIATTGRPGPVLVDIPKDVLNAPAGDAKYPEKAHIESYQPTYKGHPGQIKKAMEFILKSKRPVVYAGGGVVLSNAADELKAFVTKLKIPTTTTLMGLGGFPGTHPLFMGMLGMHGTYCANMAVMNTDCLIAVGARFDDRVTGKIDEFAPYAGIVHIDIDPTSISKNVKVDIPIVGDVRNVLKDMLKMIPAQKELTAYRDGLKEWREQTETWARTHALSYKYEPEGKIKPQYVVEKLYELTKGKAIITTEVGQNQMWAAQFFKYDRSRTFLTSGGLGTMGFGFPAAIGAQIARPDATVIGIAGDGSLQMNIQELATAVQYKLPVKVAILNNMVLGMVRQWQEFFFSKRYSYTCVSVAPDFVKLAEAYGAVGLRAKTPGEVEGVIKEALSIKNRPVFMDFKVDPFENVYPMVPSGQPLNKMLLV